MCRTSVLLPEPRKPVMITAGITAHITAQQGTIFTTLPGTEQQALSILYHVIKIYAAPLALALRFPCSKRSSCCRNKLTVSSTFTGGIEQACLSTESKHLYYVKLRTAWYHAMLASLYTCGAWARHLKGFAVQNHMPGAGSQRGRRNTVSGAAWQLLKPRADCSLSAVGRRSVT